MRNPLCGVERREVTRFLQAEAAVGAAAMSGIVDAPLSPDAKVAQLRVRVSKMQADVATIKAAAQAHAARIDAHVVPHLSRRAGGVKHPVHDFLFTYYSQRPAQLRRWHPGFGVGLEDADAYASLKGYAGDPVAVTAAYVASGCDGWMRKASVPVKANPVPAIR